MLMGPVNWIVAKVGILAVALMIFIFNLSLLDLRRQCLDIKGVIQRVQSLENVTMIIEVEKPKPKIKMCHIGVVGRRLVSTENSFCSWRGAMQDGECGAINYCPDSMPFMFTYTKYSLEKREDREREFADILVLAAEEYSYTSPEAWNNISKPSHQMWSCFAPESMNYLRKPYGKYDLDRSFFRPVKRDPRVDVSIGYSPIYYDLQAGFYPSDPNDFLIPPRPMKDKFGFISAFISNGVDFSPCNRMNYITELMQYIKVDHYGEWKKNTNWPRPMTSIGKIDDRVLQKITILSWYRFTLAFENTVDDHWLTEKFFQSIIAGCIPVYLGARNVRELFPIAHSYIDANDFENPKTLAEYLNKLNENETLYNEYFEWKKKALPQAVLDLTKMSFRYNGCRLCDYYHQNFLKEGNDGPKIK